MVFTIENEEFFAQTTNGGYGIQDDSLTSGLGLDLISSTDSGSSLMLNQSELDQMTSTTVDDVVLLDFSDTRSNQAITSSDFDSQDSDDSGSDILQNGLNSRSSLGSTTNDQDDQIQANNQDNLINNQIPILIPIDLGFGYFEPQPANDDTLDTAVAFGNLETTEVSVVNEVSSTDPLDNYSFSLDAPSEVEIVLSGLSADADVYLVSDVNNDGVIDLGETIEAPALDGTETETISTILNAGKYFIQVEQFEGDTSYTLGVQTTPYTVPVDQAGDSLETAFDLEGLQTDQKINEYVGDFDLEDYYRIEVDEPINIDVSLGGLTSDADLYLVEDANGNGELEDEEYLLESINLGTETDAIATTLFPGEYFLLVASIEGNTDYTLSTAATPFTIDLELSSDSKLATDFVGVTDPIDTYQFNLTESSLVQLDLTNLSADADLALYAELDGDLGEELAFSENGGTTSEQVLEELDPGTYYVQVQQFEGDTQYALALEATPGATAPPDPEDLSDAVDLGTFANSANLVSVNDTVSDSMPFNTYRFEVATTAQVQLELTNLTADADLLLYQDLDGDLQIELDDFEDPELVDFSEEAGDANENLELLLDPGTYYARVEQYEPSDKTDYTFSLSASPFTPPEDTVGDSADTALDLGLLEGEFTTTEFVGEVDQQDFYQFTLDEASNITLALEDLGADADLYLYQNGEEIAVSDRVGTEEEFIGLEDVAAGTYTLEVSQFAGNTNYRLALTQENFVPEGQLGVISNTFSRVTGPNSNDLELTQTPKTFTDKVNSGNNPKDYFTFTLAGQANDFKAELTELSADADLRLYKDNNNNGQIDTGVDTRLSTSNNSNTDDEEITRETLDPGAYIMEVSAWSKDVDINYTLSVSGTPPQPLGLPAITPDGITQNGEIKPVEPLDLYRFTADADLTNFRAELKGLDANVDLFLYKDTDGDSVPDRPVFRESKQVDTNDESILLDSLAAGQYLIGVRGFNEAESNYSLTVAGTVVAQVPQIPVILPGIPQEGKVSATEPQDLYRFTADADLTNFRANLTGLAADVDLFLYKDTNNNGVADEEELTKSEESSRKGGNDDETIARNTLAAGNYFIKVEGYKGAESDYTLTVAGTPPEPTPTPTPQLPNSLPTITPDGVTLNGQVTKDEPQDFYPFTALNDLVNFQATLTGLTATQGKRSDADLVLYKDVNGNGIVDIEDTKEGESIKSGEQNELITKNPLPAGQYVLEVERFNGKIGGVDNADAVDYRLIVSGGVPNPAPVTIVNAGTSIQTAPEIRAKVQQLQGNVSDANPDAFYRFDVTESGIFTADLTGLTGDADVRLINDRNNNNAIDPVTRDANGYLHAGGVEVIAWPGDRGTNDERLRAFLEPGTYYLNVNSYNQATTPYTLTTGFTAAAKDPLALTVELDFQGNLEQDAKDAVQAVADYWSTIVPYTTLDSAQTIKITVDGKDQGGFTPQGITLASAGPRGVITTDAKGTEFFKQGKFDINTNPEATRGLGLGTGEDRDLRSFFDTAFHEIGHVFTAIAIFDDDDSEGARNFVDRGATKDDPAFYVLEGNAKLAYGELLGTYQPTDVPVTKGEGGGSDFSHWQQETFGNEIFTHTDGPGDKDYFSILSIAYLKDYGFNVNYGAAEPFDLTKALINNGNG